MLLKQQLLIIETSMEIESNELSSVINYAILNQDNKTFIAHLQQKPLRAIYKPVLQINYIQQKYNNMLIT